MVLFNERQNIISQRAPTFAVRETASLGIMGAPRVPPLNPSESIVLRNARATFTANLESFLRPREARASGRGGKGGSSKAPSPHLNPHLYQLYIAMVARGVSEVLLRRRTR